MSWQAVLILVGVAAIGVAIPIIVLSVKLVAARKLADQRWLLWQSTVNELEKINDQMKRIRYEHEIKGLSDADAIKKLRDELASWSSMAVPIDIDESSGDSG